MKQPLADSGLLAPFDAEAWVRATGDDSDQANSFLPDGEVLSLLRPEREPLEVRDDDGHEVCHLRNIEGNYGLAVNARTGCHVMDQSAATPEGLDQPDDAGIVCA